MFPCDPNVSHVPGVSDTGYGDLYQCLCFIGGDGEVWELEGRLDLFGG